jgi:hypothetical protein
MRQIGARQESAKVGGIGSCGRELCCSSWLSDFKTVNTTAARYQNLSINQTKLSGQCGRLKCCLNYELDTYMDALKGFPPNAESIELQQGKAFLQKKDIFKNLMWYSFSGSNKQYPLTIERVQEILTLNAKGEKPEELEAVEIQVKSKDPEKSVDMGFVNDVGQIKLSSLKGNSNNKKRKKGGQGSEQKNKAGEQNNRNNPKGEAKAGPNQNQHPNRNNNKPKGNKPNQKQAQGNNNTNNTEQGSPKPAPPKQQTAPQQQKANQHPEGQKNRNADAQQKREGGQPKKQHKPNRPKPNPNPGSNPNPNQDNSNKSS